MGKASLRWLAHKIEYGYFLSQPSLPPDRGNGGQGRVGAFNTGASRLDYLLLCFVPLAFFPVLRSMPLP